MEGTEKTRSGGDLRPVPDPTTLTTELLRREVAALKELLQTRIDGVQQEIVHVRENVGQVDNHVKEQVGNLQCLHQEKFHSIATQFTERDTRTEQTSRDSKVAVDAALQAAKEAVGEQNKSNALAIAKSETSTTKQIDQLSVLIATNNKALDDKISTNTKASDDKIDDLKARLDRGEGRPQGIRDGWGVALGIVGLVIGIGGIVVAVISVVTRHTN